MSANYVAFDPTKAYRMKTSVPGVKVDRAFLAHLEFAAADVPAASNTAVHAAITLPDEGTLDVTTGITNPAVPRNIRIKGNASTVTGDVVIEGTNYKDEAITETIASSGTSAVDGAKAFKTITKITVPVKAAASNTISVGFGDILGLPYLLSHNTVQAAFLNKTKEGTAPTVTVSATAIDANTIDLNSALNGTAIDVYLWV